MYFFFFFKQKTAYEMRISDWSSDVCSSDLTQQTESYLLAFCHKRMKTRQFKVSRILDVFDAETGEAYASPSSFFEHFAVDQVHRSRPGWGLGEIGRAHV